MAKAKATYEMMEMICTNGQPVADIRNNTCMESKRKIVYMPSAAQWMALLPGSLIFIPGGMSLAFGLGWNLHTHLDPTKHLRFCWFIAFIVGAALAAPLIKAVTKRIFILISAILCIIGGIMFTSAPYNYNVIVAARYINGLATGVSTLAFLVHASEIAAKDNRGFCLWLEQNSMTVGILIQIVYDSQWSTHMHIAADQLHGIFAIVFGVLALFFLPWIIESPIYHVRHCDDARALHCLRRLQRIENVTPEALQVLLEEQKVYMVETETCEWRDTLAQSPLLRLVLYRSIVALGFSLPINVAMKHATVLVMGAYSWPPIVFAILRVGGTFSSLYMFDVTGRKMVSLVALLVSGVLSIAVGGEYSDELSLNSEHTMSIICILSEVFQYFAGLYAPSTAVYLCEAFPLPLKPYFIALCIGVQQVVHIIVICTFNYTIDAMFQYTLVVGILMFVSFVLFSLTMPETRKKSLEEAQQLFRRSLHYRCC